MKHNIKVTGLILLLFVLTQLIGLFVIDAFSPKTTAQIVNGTSVNVTTSLEIPYGMQPPEAPADVSFGSVAISFVIAIAIFILLMKIKAKSLFRVWFTVVVFLTISIAVTAILTKVFPHSIIRFDVVAMILAVPLTFYKVFKRDILVHNATELLIYPGIAAVFVPLLRVWSVLILLALISAYDIYAVWKSSLMMKMVKFNIQKVGILPGLFIPYMRKEDMVKLRAARKIKTVKARTAKLKKMKVAVAMLGGGDIAFSLIFAGVIYRSAGIIPALIAIACSTLALMFLFLYSRKGKMYPAMPYITVGCIIAYLITLLL